MSRLIDINMVIRMLNTMDRYTSEELTLCGTDKTFPKNEVYIVDDVYEGLDELPTVNPEPQWIPCSERLPKEEYVLISKKPTKLSGSKWCVTVAIRTADPRSGKIYWRDIGFDAIPDDNVLAWMPRPKPYREEGEQQ